MLSDPFPEGSIEWQLYRVGIEEAQCKKLAVECIQIHGITPFVLMDIVRFAVGCINNEIDYMKEIKIISDEAIRDPSDLNGSRLRQGLIKIIEEKIKNET